MKIKTKRVFTVKNIEDDGNYEFDDTELEYFGLRINVEKLTIEYFIKAQNFDTLIVSKEDFEQLQKYMEEERGVVWGNEDEDE